MKKFVLTTLALVAFAAIGPAGAADLAVKAPQPASWGYYDWTGFYVGSNGGYSWGYSTTNYTGAGITPFSVSQAMEGWFGGGQIGYNWQFNRYGVVGVEADIQGTGQNGSITDPSVGTVGATVTSGSLQQNLPWFGTARLRLGFEPKDHWLLYGTGGLAFGSIDSTQTTSSSIGGGTPTTATSSAYNTQLGWTVGGGVEWVVAGAWSAKLEYLYMDFGRFTDTFTGVGAFTTLTTSSHVTDNILRLGFNYQFSGPSVAGY